MLTILLQVGLRLVPELEDLIVELVVRLLQLFVVCCQAIELNLGRIHLSQVRPHPHFTLHVAQLLILSLHLLPQAIQLPEQILKVLSILP